MGFFGKPQETLGTREVETGLSYSIFGKNQIDTAKYNWFTFLPLNLVEQFSKNSNIYFLVLIILQCIKTISITEGVPTVLPSLVIIVIFSAFKDFLEDFQRWKSDAAENQSKVMRYLFRQMESEEKRTWDKYSLTKKCNLVFDNEKQEIFEKRQKSLINRNRKFSSNLKEEDPTQKRITNLDLELMDDPPQMPKTDRVSGLGNPEIEEILEQVEWKELSVGDIVKIHKNEYFPADLLLLETSNSKGQALVETKNLDGETNLKAKRVNTYLKDQRAKYGAIRAYSDQVGTDLSNLENFQETLNNSQESATDPHIQETKPNRKDSNQDFIEYEGFEEANSERHSSLKENIMKIEQRQWIANQTDQFLNKIRAQNLQIFYEAPNVHLYKFKGFLSQKDIPDLAPLPTNPQNIENQMTPDFEISNDHIQESGFGSNQQIESDIRRISKLDQFRINQMTSENNPKMGIESRAAQNLTLEERNLLLRGSVLRNTDFVYAMVLYTGHDTKIMLNSVKAAAKHSKLEEQLNKYIIYMFAFLVVFCLLGTTMNELWHWDNRRQADYMFMFDRNLWVDIVVRFGNWILIFGNLIPISLMVSLEGVKFIQARIISKDLEMFTEHNKTGCQVQSSNLNEELGQVEFVFSDKTGTLTKNEMVFRKLVIGDEVYGEGSIEPIEDDISVEYIVSDIKVKGKENRMYDESQISTAFWLTLEKRELQIQEQHNLMQALQSKFSLTPVSNVLFYDEDFIRAMRLSSSKREFLIHLALCHTVMVDPPGYCAASPDELALVNFAKMCGVEFLGPDDQDSLQIRVFGEILKYELLDTLEFTSSRKRMSIIVRDSEDKIWMLMKGADNKILERSNRIRNETNTIMRREVDRLAVEGLRTLLLAKRQMTHQEYAKFKCQIETARADLAERDTKVEAVEERYERDMQLIGATAIEDRLQDQIPETISFLQKAGIKLWVLTGDKVETAKTIGLSSKLLHQDMPLIEITGDQLHQVRAQVKQAITLIQKHTELDKANANTHKTKLALVISGDALIHISDNMVMRSKLAALALSCHAVLCCRVSPKQKAQIVKMVQTALPKTRTLAIGDGANDVNMITAAHIGVGIKGVEGGQAARASDYSFGEFRHLKRLLVVYGREAYRRNSTLVLYTFWKNMIVVFPQFWYALMFYNFSGMTLYDKYLYQMVNILYTSFPIIFYAVLDIEVEYSLLESTPRYFKAGLNKLYFNLPLFFMWIVKAILHSFVIMLFPSFIEFDIMGNGSQLGFWGLGMTVFLYTNIIANTNILVFSNSINFIIVVGLLGSILFLFLSFLVISLDLSNEHYGLFSYILSNTHFYMVLVCCIVAVTVTDFIWDVLQKMVFFEFIGIKFNIKKAVKVPKVEQGD